MYRVYVFVDSKGRNVIFEWAKKQKIQKRDLIRIDQRVDRLSQAGTELVPQLIEPSSGPKREKHIFELPVGNDVAIRIMLCRGPFDMESEFTLLLGAVERDRRYVPADAPERAERN